MFQGVTYFPVQQPELLLSAQNIFSVYVAPPFFVIICTFAFAGKETLPALPCTSRDQPHFFVHARQAAVFESNDKLPPVVTAYPEKTLVGVHPVGQNDQGEPRVHLFQFHRQAF